MPYSLCYNIANIYFLPWILVHYIVEHESSYFDIIKENYHSLSLNNLFILSIVWFKAKGSIPLLKYCSKKGCEFFGISSDRVETF